MPETIRRVAMCVDDFMLEYSTDTGDFELTWRGDFACCCTPKQLEAFRDLIDAMLIRIAEEKLDEKVTGDKVVAGLTNDIGGGGKE